MAVILSERDERKIEMDRYQDITESLRIQANNCLARGESHMHALLLDAASYIGYLRSEIDYLNATVSSLQEERDADMKVAEQGYAEAYKVIEDMRKRMEELKKQWEQVEKDQYEEYWRLLKEAQANEAGTGGITIILGQGVGTESGLLVQE